MANSPRPAWLTRTLRWTGIFIAVLAVLAVISWIAVPPLVKHLAEQQIEQQIGRKATIGKIAFNPLTLNLTTSDFTLYEPDKITPALSFKSLTVNASLASIIHLAPVLDEIKLSSPTVHLIRTSAAGIGRYNFSDIIDRILAKPKTEGETKFSIENIQLDNGTIKFDDKVTGKEINVAALNIGVPFISNLNRDINTFVQPKLSATINGTPFALKGRSKPFAGSQETTLALDIDQLDVASYVGFSPVALPLTIQSAKLSTKLDLNFARANSKPEINLSGDIKLSDIALADKSATPAPLLKAQTLDTQIGKFDLMTTTAVIDKVTLQAPEIWAAMNTDGKLNWATLGEANSAKASEKADAATTKAAPKAAPAIALTQLNINDGVINWTDASNASPKMEMQLKNLTVDAKHISLAANAPPAAITASVGNAGDQAIKFTGYVSPATAAVNGEASIDDLSLAQYQPYLNGALAADLSGQLSLKTQVAVADGKVLLTQLGVDIDNVKLAGKPASNGSLAVKKMSLTDASVDVEKHLFNATALTIAGIQTDVRRDARGQINLQQFAKNAKKPTKARVTSSAKKSSAPEWLANLNTVAVTDSNVSFKDYSVTPTAAFSVDGFNLKLENVSSKLDKPTKISLDTRVNKTGKLKINGTAAAQLKSFDLAIDALNLPIPALHPYLTNLFNVTLTSGLAHAKGRLQLTPPTARQTLIARYNGMVRFTNFHLVDKVNGYDFLKWKLLDVSGINADINGPRQNVTLGKITLNDFFARVILSPTGRLNLLDMRVSKVGKKSVVSEAATKSGAKAAPAPESEPAAPAGSPALAPDAAAAAAASAEAASSVDNEEAAATVAVDKTVKGDTTAATLPSKPATDSNAPAPIIHIGQIVLKSGNINFTDNFIKPNYTANMTGMNGTIGAIASDKPAPAPIDIKGKIDNDAPVAISGTFNPLFKPMFLDIKGSADGVELPRLTSYAAKYAGYAIVKGKLSMEVEYKIEEQKLTAQNHLKIDQFTFGDKIDSPTATKLPVRLAIALLKDRNGVIDINLPISGSLSDPHFSMGGIIIRVIVNLIVKAVTSPFALIGNMFGSGGADLSYIEFKPGLATLTPESKAKLDTLVKALIDRPALKMDIIGRVDPDTDTVGLRQAMLNHKMNALKQKHAPHQAAAETHAETAADTDIAGDTTAAKEPQEITLTDADKAQYMEKVYKDEKFDKPRNMIGFTKSLPVPEMEKLILTNAKVTPDELRNLADQRAQAVRDYLQNVGKIPLDRVFLIAPKLTADGIKDKGKPNRVDFSMK
ncbi:DUF748 domain-containing protein [Glaciimonas soli]|uniref:DUF748 domain-containing protein n=1 Tax=Glaciimonas soli TaxID=2590999 RepID=A0A843YY15_9BURK|nr:DUF748 domain-containing protein [Glaciimonas soli]MQR02554.1 DUF748 domain-containing protein [Glaciimonas soli]